MTMMTIVASVLVAAVEMMKMTMTTGTNGMIATMTITMMMMTTTGAVVPDQEDDIAMTTMMTMMTTKPPAFLIW